MSKLITDLVSELKRITSLSNVYISPPAKGMKYPCVLCELDGESVHKADNIRYLSKDRYSITIVDKEPDSVIYKKILEYYPYCTFNRFYTVDGLAHFVLTLYY